MSREHKHPRKLALVNGVLVCRLKSTWDHPICTISLNKHSMWRTELLLTSNVDIRRHSHFRQIHVFLQWQMWAHHVWRHELTGSLETGKPSPAGQHPGGSEFGFYLLCCSRTDWGKTRLWILKKSLNTLNFLQSLKDWTSQKSLHCQWGCSGSWSSVIKVFLSLWKKSTSVKIQILRIKTLSSFSWHQGF